MASCPTILWGEPTAAILVVRSGGLKFSHPPQANLIHHIWLGWIGGSFLTRWDREFISRSPTILWPDFFLSQSACRVGYLSLPPRSGWDGECHFIVGRPSTSDRGALSILWEGFGGRGGKVGYIEFARAIHDLGCTPYPYY